jgi:hypothetical protein
MARFVALNFGLRHFEWVVVGLSLAACFSIPLLAQSPAPMQTTATPPAPAAPSAKAPATNAAPVLPPDTLGQYGKILGPSDQMGHPLKLRMPFPGVGEVKVPNQEEMNMREKLEQLARLSDDDIHAQLEKWPAYGKMNLRDQGAMLQRIQDFRDYHTNIAKARAHDMGLLTLSADQQAKFEKDYWDKRLQMDHELAKQFDPIFKARLQKLQDELYREFSAPPVTAVPPPAKPPAPPVNQPPPAAAQGKPQAPATPVANAQGMQPAR